MAAMQQGGRTRHVFALRGLSRDSLTPGIALACTEQTGKSPQVGAERNAVSGLLKEDAIHAKRAVGRLPRGSTGWRCADDIVRAPETQEKRNKRK